MPTMNSTDNPSANPSLSPTRSPSSAPSSIPSQSPSYSPTSSPVVNNQNGNDAVWWIVACIIGASLITIASVFGKREKTYRANLKVLVIKIRQYKSDQIKYCFG